MPAGSKLHEGNKTVKTVAEFVREHALFDGMQSAQVDFIAGCGQLKRFAAGDYLVRESDPADHCYLIVEGRVVIETHRHNQPPAPLLTLNANDIIGWSWLIPPYRYQFDARAVSDLRTVQLDGRCIRDKCEADPVLGYQLLKRISSVMASRIHCARFQLLDVYGSAAQGESLQ